MKIATYNANSIRTRLPVLKTWLENQCPDILCIQETKVQNADFPIKQLEKMGYHAAFRGEKSYNGVAVLSLTPADEANAGFDDGGPRDSSRLLRVRYGDLHIINTYVPQGRSLDHQMYAYKKRWFKRLRKMFNQCYDPAQKVIWCGDLNVALQPVDVHHAEEHQQHVCHHMEVRKALQSCLDWGFIDVFRGRHPEEAGYYSFFDYRQPHALERGLGWRIDYILATSSLAAACCDSFIDLEPRQWEKCSDHTFVVAEFAC